MTSRAFPPEAVSVPAVRRFVLGELEGLSEEATDSISVMVSELATNAVLHARSEFVVKVEDFGSSVLVEVSDAGGGTPTPQAPNPTALHGRGLIIVEKLSDEWGVTPGSGGHGKTVWFRLTTDRSPSELRC